MQIEVADTYLGSDGAVMIRVYDANNQVMDVTDYAVFDAMLNGRMTSNTVKLTPDGLTVLLADGVQNIPVRMTASDARKLGKLDKFSSTQKKYIKDKYEELVQRERVISKARISAKREAEQAALYEKTRVWNSLSDAEKAALKKRPKAILLSNKQ